MSRYSNGQHRYCVILAGGDGTRLRQLTQCVSADERPKQFCPFLGGWTPLRATRQRAVRSLDPERTLFVVTRAHERYYADELADVRPWQVLIQPDNKGTAPAILLSLLHLNRLDPEASVVFLPSDHHYLDERGFLDAVHRAFEAGDERTHPRSSWARRQRIRRSATAGSNQDYRSRLPAAVGFSVSCVFGRSHHCPWLKSCSISAAYGIRL
jgi:Nucleotidyl transferase